MDASTNHTILLVEDEENDVVFMELALEKAGLSSSVRVAVDGQEALDYLSGQGAYADRTRFAVPALVFLDLKLPLVMGMEVLKWIREQPALDTMVVIMLTSSQQRSDIERASALGANSYLVKPSNPARLEQVVDLVKRYWLELNQPTATMVSHAGSVAVCPAGLPFVERPISLPAQRPAENSGAAHCAPRVSERS